MGAADYQIKRLLPPLEKILGKQKYLYSDEFTIVDMFAQLPMKMSHDVSAHESHPLRISHIQYLLCRCAKRKAVSTMPLSLNVPEETVEADLHRKAAFST